MDFSWDESKRKWVPAKRGIGFLLVADTLFDGRPLLTVPTPRGEEERFLSIRAIEARLFAVIWTWRGCDSNHNGKEGQGWRRKTIPCVIRLRR
jgi:uncharacterized DUF497 family protein